jgi:hypothetical protein
MVIIRYFVNIGLLALLCLSGNQAWATTIDVMVLFDTKAKSWADNNGGMQNIAATAVAKMNAAAANSGISSLSFDLAHFQAMPYTTSSNGDTSLENDLDVLGAAAGGLSAVPSLRASYGADLVTLLVDTGKDYGYTGIAYLLSSRYGDPNSAYSVCAIRSVVLSHTLTHEIGHNLGAHHSKYQADSPGPNYALNSYSAGWYFTGAGGEDYHTIMAYGNDGYGNTYVEAPYFSTPARTYNGGIVGHALHGDNVSTITETMNFVAAYRDSNVCGAPSSLFVPGSDADGTYTVSWGASTTSGATYVLEEAANSTFSSGLRTAYSGPEMNTTISGRNGGSTYYYRVKASRIGYADSLWQVGANGCSVTLPTVSTPESITVPASDDDGSYIITWSESATADVTYTLEEATNRTFTSGLRTVYTGADTSTAVSGRLSLPYYYRVKAGKSGYSDSAWRTAGNGCDVVMPAGTPASLTVPREDSDGSYTVRWGSSSAPGARYQLVEATDDMFTENLRTAYTGSATSTSLVGRSVGTYYYRVAAMANGYYTSFWQTAGNGCTVTPATTGQPASIAVPASDSDGTYTITWGKSATAGATFVLEEAADRHFAAGRTTVYSGTGTSAIVTGRPGGTFFYRVKAGMSGLTDSNWVTGANGCAILPSPPKLTFSVDGLNVSANWTASPGADGYTLLAAPYPFTGMESIISIDMGKQRAVSVTMWAGAAFYIAVQSRNIHGSSDYSNIECFILATP